MVMSIDDYIKEGIRKLSDANFYVKLDYDPTPNHIDEIHNTLLKALQRDEITKKILEFLVPTDCTTPAWYFLPKIHKEKITWRPISGNNSPTEKISAFVDKHIKMMVPLIQYRTRISSSLMRAFASHRMRAFASHRIASHRMRGNARMCEHSHRMREMCAYARIRIPCAKMRAYASHV